MKEWRGLIAVVLVVVLIVVMNLFSYRQDRAVCEAFAVENQISTRMEVWDGCFVLTDLGPIEIDAYTP